LAFRSGQFIVIQDPRTRQKREYSVYSGENDDYLEVLVREVEGGKVSGRLKKLVPGEMVGVEGPFGFFRLAPDLFPSPEYLFIASGTGISPFHSFVKTFPDAEYRLIHGVRLKEESYDYQDYERDRIVQCVSGENEGDFHGRVTGYLASVETNPDLPCFLCGNSMMIQDVFDILTGKGVPVSNICSEVYF
jgi:NAD(P)H-flavin reductase